MFNRSKLDRRLYPMYVGSKVRISDPGHRLYGHQGEVIELPNNGDQVIIQIKHNMVGTFNYSVISDELDCLDGFVWETPKFKSLVEFNYVVTHTDEEGPEYLELRPFASGLPFVRWPEDIEPPKEVMEHFHG